MKQIKLIITALITTAAMVSCQQVEPQQQIQPRALLDSAIAAHGGGHYDGATISFGLNNYDFKLKREGYTYDYEMSQEKDGVLHKVNTFNGGLTYKIGDSLVDQGGRQMTLIRERVNNVAYDFYIPYSLTGNDVILEYLGMEDMRLKPYHKLKVSYKQIPGGDPDHRAYILWISKDTYEIDFIAKQNDETSGRKQFMAAAYKRRVNSMLFSDFELYQTAGRNKDVRIDSLGIAYNTGNMQRKAVTTYRDVAVSLPED
ncbi:DUF6503 family protein [Gilvibacter sp.]|uniref:DUF6503 family protein n=1 Tax=Gilvibacter sp. TaxID=2729997 RepID=UPI0025BCFC2E|nr:DUF6503 family protein [Gilvibacter sp.]NQX76142.1 hypothetical protein [Gilvibacter sp.]